MSLTLQDLQDIVAICEAGSFRKAAERLGVAQPTLSSRVALMEARLGTSLFDRVRGRSRPTQLARTIARESGPLLGEISGVLQQVERIAEGSRGLLRMGLGPVPVFSLLGPLLRRIDASIPGASVEVHSGAANRLLDRLAAQEIDLAVCVGGPDLVRPEFEIETLVTDRLVALVRPGHALGAFSHASLADVLRHPVALTELDDHYRVIGRKAAGVELTSLPNTVFCSNFWVLQELVASGRYATVCPAFCFAGQALSGQLLQIPLDDNLVHLLCLYTNRFSLPLPVVSRAIALIREQSADLQRAIDDRTH